MKTHRFLAILVLLLAIGCAPSSTPEPTRLPDTPTVQLVIDTATATATSEPTYTPIVDTPTLAAMLTNTPTLTNTAISTATNTRLPTKRPTLKPTAVRAAPTIRVLPTKIPTIFVAPTNPPPPPPPSGGCCKHCTPGKSKPCGDSCISVDKTCHQPPGCAC